MFDIFLYHGTILGHLESIKAGISIAYSHKYTDFGQGFYLSSQQSHAELTAMVRSNANRKFLYELSEPVVIRFELPDDAFEELRWKSFFAPDKDWKEFVLANRCKNEMVRQLGFNHNQDGRYDVVIGPVADGANGILTVLCSKISSGELTIPAVNLSDIAPSQNKCWGEQWSFHSDKAISCLKFVNVIYCNRKVVSA